MSESQAAAVSSDASTKEGVLNNDGGKAKSSSDVKTAFTSKLSPKGRAAEVSVAKNKYNVEAWTTLMNEALRLPVNDARPIYDKCLEVFPTAVSLRCPSSYCSVQL